MTRIAIAAERGAVYYAEAAVFGDWAAHACHCCETTWAVTHIPSGRRVHSEVQIAEEEALAIARALSVDVAPGCMPVILPSDTAPRIPIDVVRRINDAFYGTLNSLRDRAATVDRGVGRDHVGARGDRE